MKNFDAIDFEEGETGCPKHNTKQGKRYTYGSSMTGETDVYTFVGCQCAVSIRHDPVGTYPSTARYHTTFGEAEGTARLHRNLCAAKYRD